MTTTEYCADFCTHAYQRVLCIADCQEYLPGPTDPADYIDNPEPFIIWPDMGYENDRSEAFE